MSEHGNQEQEQYPTRVVDKRGLNKKQQAGASDPLPSAQELLEDLTGSEFERQRAEEEAERARLAAWEDLSEDEKQAIIAQQAAEEGSTPFAGGGIQTEGEVAKEVLTVFVVVVDLDGTATAMPMGLFEEKVRDTISFERDADPRVMYRSCAEIMMDVEVAETAHTTLQMFNQVGQHMAAQQRAQALATQLEQRRGKRR